jgi:flagellin-specific chaperone FliS
MGPLEDNMNTTKKTTNQTVSAAAAEKTEVVETVATLYTNGVERLAEVQKKAIDLAVKHNAELLDAWKKMARHARSCIERFRSLRGHAEGRN